MARAPRDGRRRAGEVLRRCCVNGGEIALDDVRHSIDAGRPVVASTAAVEPPTRSREPCAASAPTRRRRAGRFRARPRRRRTRPQRARVAARRRSRRAGRPDDAMTSRTRRPPRDVRAPDRRTDLDDASASSSSSAGSTSWSGWIRRPNSAAVVLPPAARSRSSARSSSRRSSRSTSLGGCVGTRAQIATWVREPRRRGQRRRRRASSSSASGGGTTARPPSGSRPRAGCSFSSPARTPRRPGHTPAYPVFADRVEELIQKDVDVYITEVATEKQRQSGSSEP